VKQQVMMARANQTNDLPDPDQRPGSDVVLWDGECNFCRKQVNRLRALDLRSRLSFLSLHDDRAAERYPQLNHQQMLEEMWVITANGARYGGADALRYLSRALPTLWPLAPLLHLPMSMRLWRRLYREVARRRYQLAGKQCDNGSCQLHAHALQNAPVKR
jgi:predicted DCC family thiol-disulfide oxidoreductase YuxK